MRWALTGSVGALSMLLAHCTGCHLAALTTPAHERARIHRREWAEVGKGAVVRDRGDSVYPAMESPDQLLVVAAGGPAGGFGAIIPPWLGNKSHAVTMAIGACVDCEPPKK